VFSVACNNSESVCKQCKQCTKRIYVSSVGGIVKVSHHVQYGFLQVHKNYHEVGICIFVDREFTDTALEWFFVRGLKRLQSTLRAHIFISLCIKLHKYNRRLIHLKSLVYYLSLSHSTVTN